MDALDRAFDLDLDRRLEIAAEHYGVELMQALQDVIASGVIWPGRGEAQELLRCIARCELHKPLNELGAR